MKRSDVEDALKGWLNSSRLNTLITVTLKQALPIRHGKIVYWAHLTRDEVVKTAKIIRDRAGKKVRRRGRETDPWPFLVFVHENGPRRHFHILTERPSHMSSHEFRSRFERAVQRRLDWVYDYLHYSDIKDDPSDRQRALGYGLKGGINQENFLIEASFIG